MNYDVVISCAVTGDDTKVTKSPHCAVTPEQIAATAIEAAKAGAAIVHIHVRDPETGGFSMETKYYREVVKRIRDSKVDVIVNLTCGMGGYIVIGDNGLKDTPAPGSDFCTQEERMRHVIDLCQEGKYRPDICTLDCGSLNFGDGNRAYVSTPNYLRQGMQIAKDLGVKPELEIFDTQKLLPALQRQKPTVRVEHFDAVRSAFNDTAVELFANAQRAICLPAQRNVTVGQGMSDAAALANTGAGLWGWRAGTGIGVEHGPFPLIGVV